MLFQYTQLAKDSIRLLRFHPLSTPSDIHLTLEHQARYFDKSSHKYSVLTTSSPYHQDQRKSITLSGRTRLVPSSIWDALSAISQGERRDTRYWIDVFCINQTDEREKAEQSAQLPRIYSCADKILLWLGQEDEVLRESFMAMDKARKNEQAQDDHLNENAPKDDRADTHSLIEKLLPVLSRQDGLLQKQEERLVLLSGKLECEYQLLRGSPSSLDDSGITGSSRSIRETL